VFNEVLVNQLYHGVEDHSRDNPGDEDHLFADFEVVFYCYVLPYSEVVPFAHILDNLASLLDFLSLLTFYGIFCFQLLD
jgi:hypothetical protein